MKKKIIAISGSLRKDSYNTSLLRNIILKGQEHFDFELIEPLNLPIFSEDIEKDSFPEIVKNVSLKITNADAVIISTPEYNRSIPGGLKNFIDWISRGDYVKCFLEKKVIIVGASSGKLGTVSAQHDLKKIMLYFGAEVIGKPEFYLGENKTKFDDSFTINDQITGNMIDQLLERMIQII